MIKAKIMYYYGQLLVAMSNSCCYGSLMLLRATIGYYLQLMLLWLITIANGNCGC